MFKISSPLTTLKDSLIALDTNGCTTRIELWNTGQLFSPYLPEPFKSSSAVYQSSMAVPSSPRAMRLW